MVSRVRILIAFALIGATTVGAFGAPSRAQAQLVPQPVTDVPLLGHFTVKEVAEKTEKGIWSGVVLSFFQTIEFFLQKQAYSVATYIASGGKGQTPLIISAPWRIYEDAAFKDSAGHFLGSLTENWDLKKYGIDLCAPSTPGIRARITLDLFRQTIEPKAKCDWKQISQNYEKFTSESQTDEFLAKSAVQFAPGQNDLSILAQTSQAVQAYSARETAAKIAEQERQRTKPVTDQTSGGVKTTKEDVAEAGKIASPGKQTEQTTMSASQLASGPSLLAASKALGNFFINTLGSKLLDRLFKEGFPGVIECFGATWCPPEAQKEAAKAVATGEGAAVYGRAQAELAFADLITPRIVQGGSIDFVSEFSTCPEEGRTPNNCTIDDSFSQAVHSADVGAPKTVSQALSEGLLHSQWQLLPASKDPDGKRDCYSRAYCEANLKKLRLARVLPVGFEIAARLSPVDKPWTLGQVIAGFSDCAADPATGKAIYDAAKPFCHLIDPNFLLKAPPARCTARVPGPILASPQGPNRANICVDAQTCTAQAANGACTGEGAWGYCLKEKNTWHLQADSCPAQFATCTAFTGRDGSSSSYLLSTVDYGACTADNAGCRAYAIAQDKEAHAWKDSPLVFLDKDAEDCPSTDKGCARLVRASSTPQGFEGDEVFLKVAPDYLQCAGAGAWPATVAKLNETIANQTVDQKKACSDYAPVCAQSEVGCERFTPVDGDPAVPAKLASDGSDLCPAECVGYQTFKQVASPFEGERFPLYFIPSTAAQCTASDVGCEQFTNLDELARGGEAVAHFKAVRHCITPTDESKYATFFTWEGSDTAGYQLRAFTLMKSNQLGGATPCTKIIYNNDTGVASCADALTDADDPGAPNDPTDDCSAATYKDNPDCRQFYSQNPTIAGAPVQITYRLFSKTVSVTEDCHPFRKTLRETSPVEETNCKAGGGFWNTEQGACIYSASPGESNSCSAPSAGCRAYTGNAGNNTKTLFFSTFEGGSADGWTGGTLSTESTALNGHSLKVTQGGALKKAITATKDKAYFLTFWAKGSGILTAAFSTSPPSAFSPPPALASLWQQYALGPLIAAQSGETTLMLAGFSATSFIDNIVLKETDENLAVVRDSWVTPLSCDANPADALPGAALGCEAYKDRQGDAWNIRSFSQVCREQAIGCELFTDTKNTETKEKKLFNLRCNAGTQPAAQPKSCVLADLETPVCTVTQGQKSCRFHGEERDTGTASSSGTKIFELVVEGKSVCRYVNDVTAEDIGEISQKRDCLNAQNQPVLGPFWIDASSILVPADSTAALVNSPQFSCAQEFASCSALGLKTYNAATKNSSYSTVYKKNNPDAYDAILCDAGAEGCDAWSAGASQYYFKDPKATGALCEWKDSAAFVSITTGEKAKGNGWVRQGIGVCKSQGGTYTAAQCGSDADCDQAKQESCDKGASVRCDTTSLGFPAGILTQGKEPAFEDNGSFTGVCSAQWNTCTELRDPVDASEAHPQGQPYFALKNQKFQGLLNDPSCTGGASLYKGCALFDDTSNPAKSWSAQATYAESDKKGGALVAPFSGGSKAFGMCYGNKKIKIGFSEITVPYVKGTCASDADCGAAPSNVTGWHCETSALPNNANTLLKVSRDRACGEWLACKTSEEVFDKGLGSTRHVCTQLGVCTEATSGAAAVGPCAKWKEPDTAFFDEKQYVGRDTSWFGDEYSGYTISRQYPIAALTTQSQGEDNPATLVFAKAVKGQPTKYFRPDGASIPSASDGLDLSCRGYSELDSPFPATVAAEKTPYGAAKKPAPGFENANLCHSFIDLNSNGVKDASDPEQNCECNYTKAKYKGGETQYFTAYAPSPAGVCGGGFTADGKSKDGKSCTRSLECRDERKLKAGENAEDGVCNTLDDADTFRGWEGYCLERDFSTPINGAPGQYACLTWLPLELAGGTDVYNLYAQAGYVPPPGSGQLYCLEGKGNAGRGYGAATGGTGDPLQGTFGYRALMVLGYHDKIDKRECTVNGRRCKIVYRSGDFDGYCQFITGSTIDTQEGCYLSKTYDSNLQPKKLTETAFGTNLSCEAIEAGESGTCVLSGGGHQDTGLWPATIAGEGTKRGSVLYKGPQIHQDEIERLGIYVTEAETNLKAMTKKEYFVTRAPMRSIVVLEDIGAYTGPDPLDSRTNTTWKNWIFKMRQGGVEEAKKGAFSWSGVNWETFDPFHPSVDCDEDGFDNEFAAVKFRFNNNGYYTGYDWVMCNEEEDQTFFIEASLYMYFREMCTALAYVTSQDSGPVPTHKARTNKLWATQPLSPANFDSLYYEFRTPFVPFSSGNAATSTVPLFSASDLSGSGGNPWSCLQSIPGSQCGTMLTTCVDGPFKGQACRDSEECKDPDTKIACSSPGVCTSGALQVGDEVADPNFSPCFTNDDCTNATHPFCNTSKKFQPENKEDIITRCNGGYNRLKTCSTPDDCRQFACELDAPLGGTCLGGAKNGLGCVVQSDCPDARIQTHTGEEIIDQGICSGLAPTVVTDASGKPLFTSFANLANNLEKAVQTLQNIFARVMSVWTLSTRDALIPGGTKSLQIPKYIQSGIVSSGKLDVSQQNAQAGTPRIAPAVKGNGSGFAIAKAGQNATLDNVAISGKTSGMQVADTLFSADLSFFAWADKDQMPISRIAIDWDDGGNVLTLSGLYQNRKPYCSQGSSKEGAAKVCLNNDNLTCETDDDCPQGGMCQPLSASSPQLSAYAGFHFGNSLEACSTQPFSFTHTYTYPTQTANSTPLPAQCKKLAEHQNSGRLTPTEIATLKFAHAVKDTDTVCVFIPKVQVKDNWGWCNGSKDLSGNDPGKWDRIYDPQYADGASNKCGADGTLIPEDAWTPYRGKVIVLP